jgi:putative transposase
VVWREEAHEQGARYIAACDLIGISTRTLQRWKREGLRDRRKGANKRVNRKVPMETREEIVNVCNEQRFRDLTPYEIVPQLLSEGCYLASESTFYRVLREKGQVHHRSELRVGHRHSKPPERRATGSDQVYSWDITYMNRTVRGMYYYAYVVKDIFDKAIVGWAVHTEESEIHSRALFERMLKGQRTTVRYVHSDNGHPMKGVSLMALLKELKVDVSHSRPRTSNDNAYIESLFKTMKYHVTYPNAFDTLEDARLWMGEFVNWYNTVHQHSSIGYVTPHQLRHGQANAIYGQRNATLQLARTMYPERWGARPARAWEMNREVVLNPDKK